MVSQEISNDIPVLQFDDFPFSLELEYLMAVGAGREANDPMFGSSWSQADLLKVQAVGAGTDVRARFSGFFDKLNNGRSFTHNLVAVLTKGLNERIKERVFDAKKAWEAEHTDDDRRRLHTLALDRYGLSSHRAEREKQFLEIYRKLKTKRRRNPLDFDRKIGLLGFRDLRAEPIGKSGFYRYLQEGNLPYFSRDAYMRELGDVDVDLSEKDIIDSLNDAEAERTLLISGPGGVGKTRLASHICHASNAEFILTPLGGDQNYLRLVEHLQELPTQPKHIIILRDYAERVDHSGGLDFFRLTLSEELEIRTSLILCSRATGFRKVTSTFPEIDTHFRIGENSSRNSLSYENWLVDRILSSFDLSGNNFIKGICRDRPMIAAFAGYLSVDHPEAFARQFAMETSQQSNTDESGYAPPLLADHHFQEWMERRARVFQDQLGSVGKRRAAEVALALPFQSARDQDRILDEATGIRRQAFEILHEDGWIDQSGEHFASISHDVLADSLVNTHLFGDPKKATQRIRELLIVAAEYGYLRRALRALDRIIPDGNLSYIDAKGLLEALERDNADAVQMNAFDLLQSRILPNSQLPELIENIASFAEGLDADPSAHANLARIASELRGKGSISLNATKHAKFFSILENVPPGADARTVAYLVAFSPERHARRAVSFIRRYKSRYDTGFVFRAYLDAGLDPSAIGPHVVEWLERFGKQKGASYVLQAWFKKMSRLVEIGEVWNPALRLQDVMLRLLELWCRRHRSEPTSAWCIQALIEHGGLGANSDLVDHWLSRHGKTPLASYVIQKALPNKDVDPHLAVRWTNTWLDSRAIISNSVPAVHIIRELKNCVKKRKIINFSDVSEAVEGCLSADWPMKSRRDACVYWLEMGGCPNVVKSLLQKAVQQDYTDPNVRFAFEAWFEADTDEPFLFKAEMKLWLEANPGLTESSYVFGFWDRLGFDIAEVTEPLGVWLRRNHEHSHYSFFLGKMLKTSPKYASTIGISEQSAPAFLAKEKFAVQDCRIIEFVLRAPFGKEGNGEIHDQAIAAADRFLRQHIGEVASAFLISLVLRIVGNERWIRSYADEWLTVYSHRHRASLIYQTLLFVEPEPECLHDVIQDWFTENPTYELAGSLLMAWIEAECDPEMLRPAAKIWREASMKREEYPDVEAVEKWYEI